MRTKCGVVWTLIAMPLLLSAPMPAAATTSLFARGYTVLPQPQTVELRGEDFTFGAQFRIERGPGIAEDDVAVATLREELRERFGLQPSSGGSVIRLAIEPGAVAVGQAADRDRDVLAREAYRIDLASGDIRITANAGPGLFYGAETLVQLLQRRKGALLLPEGRIVDWPDLQYRALYWDDAHHLERLPELKRAIRQASFFKFNAFSIKLEGHFQYKSAPAIVEPYALSPAELQELTDYGLRYNVQVVPFLDGPAHIAFILKHPEYAKLREYPQSNYELCVTNPDSYKLLTGMYQDLLEANRGVKYFYLSTDEPYYVGLADNAQCQEARRAKELGSVGKLLAEFLDKAAGYLHERGRTVIFWGEYPLKPGDIASLPSYLVNGEVYGPAFDPVFKAHGIRSMIYSSSQGEERLFPQYYVLPRPRWLHPGQLPEQRVPGLYELISFTQARKNADLMGMVNAAWADAGLHPETFWLGYAAAAAYSWHPGSPGPEETAGTFFPLYYGPEIQNMARVYQLMSMQAQVWSDSWETIPSVWRKGIFGYSAGIYDKPKPEHDQTISLPPVPSAQNLAAPDSWTAANAKRLDAVSVALAENDELLAALHSDLRRAERNKYNLEVFISVAQLCRQNLNMIRGLSEISSVLKSAREETDATESLLQFDRALEIAQGIKRERNRVLRDTVDTWYKSWHPRVAEANGRRFLHELDDVKDHVPDRTVDMTYLIYRQLNLPFGEWSDKVLAVRNDYARRHNLPVLKERLDWKDTGL